MSSNLFNFYIDDELKQQVVDKLEKVSGKKEKGQMAALIRVLLKDFVSKTPTPNLLTNIEAEYTYSTLKNKRSKL